jgi:DNA repair protein SbcC/Rad50
MKVLSLRFINLNSLRGEFFIDFSREPFVDAGLFAVIGPTGAGKSTIFDALSVALYGETPRLQKRKSAGAGVLELVSRHTTEAWAEVEFEVPSGTYRSRWEVHRARGSVTGAFQQPRMRLARIDSAAEELIEDKLSEVPERISRLTGLDFTRFTRSVLLAQGAFAAFLEARPGERADLLEKMTGSFIYSELSRLAYERAKEEEQKGAEIARRIDDIRIFDEESLSRVLEQLTEAGERCSLARERRDGMVLAAEKARRGQKLSAQLNETDALLKALEADRETIESRREQLRLHRLVEPHWNNIRRFDAAAEELSRTAEAIDGLNTSLKLRSNEIEELGSEAVAARQALVEAQDERTTVREKKGEAEKLEALLSERRARLEDEDQRIERTDRQRARNVEDIEALQRKLDDLEREKQKHEVLTGNSGLTELSQKREIFLLRLSERTTLKQEIQSLTEECELLREEAQTFSGPDNEGAASQLAVLKKELSQQEEALAQAGDPETFRRELADIDGKLGRQHALAPWAQRKEALKEDLARVRRRVEELESETESTRRDSEEARAAREQAEAGQTRFAAVRLKEGLKRGVPCPVCGSKEHPAVEQQELFEEPGPEGQEAEYSAAENEYRDALIRLASVQGSLDTQLEKATELEQEISALNTRLNDANYSPAAIEELDRTRAERAEGLEKVTVLEKRRDEIRLQLEELRDQDESRREEYSRGLNRAALVIERIRSLEENLRQKQESFEQASVSIREWAQRAGLTGDFEQLRETAAARIDDYRSASAEVEKITAEQRSSSERIEQQSGILAERRAELNELVRRRDELKSYISELKKNLTELTGGLSVAELLDQREQQVREKEESLQELQNRLSAEKEKRAGLQGRLETAEHLHKEKMSEFKTLQEDLIRRARAAEFESLEEFRTAFLDDAESFKEAVDDWEAQKKDLVRRRDELAQELEEIPPELRDSTRTEQDLESADREYAEAQKELFECQSKINADTEKRERRDELLKEQEEQRREYNVWWRLKELIGSAKGDAFRRFAQGLTLDYLVSLANRHLERFSGRYFLRRDGGEELSLSIVDTWQADAVRPVETLSGGETFLASLSLALGLSELAGRKTKIDSLFLDEGFGTLDAETLETVLAALETLRSSGKLVGIISHVEALKERIPVQIRVRRKGTGYSTLTVSPEPSMSS